MIPGAIIIAPWTADCAYHRARLVYNDTHQPTYSLAPLQPSPATLLACLTHASPTNMSICVHKWTSPFLPQWCACAHAPHHLTTTNMSTRHYPTLADMCISCSIAARDSINTWIDSSNLIPTSGLPPPCWWQRQCKYSHEHRWLAPAGALTMPTGMHPTTPWLLAHMSKHRCHCHCASEAFWPTCATVSVVVSRLEILQSCHYSTYVT